MDFIFILCAILCVVCTSLACLKNLHIFQLNTYRAVEQFKWIKKNYIKLIFHFIGLIFAAIVCLLHNRAGYVLLGVLMLISLPLCMPLKNAKKPIVYTSRMKRLIETSAVVEIAVIVLACFVPAPYKYMCLALLFALAPILPIISNVINMPAEKAVRQYYINDAKKMLAQCPNLIVIGITGSYGKTSVKYYLNSLLKTKYNVLMTPESFNTPMGVVKTIREQLRPTHEIFICEMGAKRVGEIKELCDIVHPTHGILTAVGEQHLETFKSIENIIKTKFELADAVADKGVIFLNGDNSFIRDNLPDQKYFTYGISDINDYHAENLSVSQSGTEFTFIGDGETIDGLHTRLIGEHNVVNLAGAIAMAKFLGVPDNQIRIQLNKLTPPPHRLQLSQNGGVTIIDDAYNSNPSGSKAALNTLALFDGYKVLVTPGMIDLGVKQDELNRRFGIYAAEVCDFIILVGEKQAEPIYDGIASTDYDLSKVFVASGIKEAISKAYSLQTDKPKIVLLENDLPDNYL